MSQVINDIAKHMRSKNYPEMEKILKYEAGKTDHIPLFNLNIKLSKKYPINSPNSIVFLPKFTSHTLVMEAIELNNLDALKILLSYGAPFNTAHEITINGQKYTLTPLDFAIQKDNVDIVKILLANISNNNQNPGSIIDIMNSKDLKPFYYPANLIEHNRIKINKNLQKIQSIIDCFDFLRAGLAAVDYSKKYEMFSRAISLDTAYCIEFVNNFLEELSILSKKNKPYTKLYTLDNNTKVHSLRLLLEILADYFKHHLSSTKGKEAHPLHADKKDGTISFDELLTHSSILIDVYNDPYFKDKLPFENLEAQTKFVEGNSCIAPDWVTLDKLTKSNQP